LLLEALRGCDDAVVAALGTLGRWEVLAAVYEEGWLGDEVGTTSLRASAARVRGGLRRVAAARRSLAEAVAGSGGEICVDARLVEPGSGSADLTIDDDSGESAIVDAAAARVLGGELAAGDRVTVLGVLAVELDLAAAPAAPRRLPRRVVIRGAAERRLIIVRTAPPTARRG
jgi:hypothetical protein